MPTLQPIAANRGISPQKSETLELATAIPRQLPQPRTVDFAQFLGSVTKAEYWQPTVRTREKHGRIRLSFAMNSVPKITKPMTSVTLGYFDGQTEKWWQSIIIRPKTVFTISPQPFGHHEYPRIPFGIPSRSDNQTGKIFPHNSTVEPAVGVRCPPDLRGTALLRLGAVRSFHPSSA